MARCRARHAVRVEASRRLSLRQRESRSSRSSCSGGREGVERRRDRSATAARAHDAFFGCGGGGGAAALSSAAAAPGGKHGSSSRRKSARTAAWREDGRFVHRLPTVTVIYNPLNRHVKSAQVTGRAERHRGRDERGVHRAVEEEPAGERRDHADGAGTERGRRRAATGADSTATRGDARPAKRMGRSQRRRHAATGAQHTAKRGDQSGGETPRRGRSTQRSGETRAGYHLAARVPRRVLPHPGPRSARRCVSAPSLSPLPALYRVAAAWSLRFSVSIEAVRMLRLRRAPPSARARRSAEVHTALPPLPLRARACRSPFLSVVLPPRRSSAVSGPHEHVERRERAGGLALGHDVGEARLERDRRDLRPQEGGGGERRHTTRRRDASLSCQRDATPLSLVAARGEPRVTSQTSDARRALAPHHTLAAFDSYS